MLEGYFPDGGFSFDSVSCGVSPDLVEQPVNIGGMICCVNRIRLCIEEESSLSENYDIIISIENSIDNRTDSDETCEYHDIVNVAIFDTISQIYYFSKGGKLPIETTVSGQAKSESDISLLGWSVCVGDIYSRMHKDVSRDNWMATMCGVDRHVQIQGVFEKCFEKYVNKIIDRESMKANMRYYQNFPEEDVLFQDISPLLYNHVLFDNLTDYCEFAIQKKIGDLSKIDAFVGLESRGFIFASALAKQTKKGLVLIRKKGKLSNAVGESYEKEYGGDTMEIQPDSLCPGDRVVVVDDLIATGGSLKCAENLVKRCNATVVAHFCLSSVDELWESATELLDSRVITLF